MRSAQPSENSHNADDGPSIDRAGRPHHNSQTIDDIEKGASGTGIHAVRPESDDAIDSERHAILEKDGTTSFIKGLWQRFMKSPLVEERGIRRVEEWERHDLRTLGYTQMGVLWFSINLAANNSTLGMLGPAAFYLGFKDACLCAALGSFVGCIPVAYMAGFGPISGNRTLVTARYAMGWWPAKLVVVLNIIVCLGYALIGAVVAGQILSAVSPNGSLSVVVGIIIVAVITLLITTFGYRIVHFYVGYAWLPQLVVLSLLAGVAGPNFNLASETEGNTETRIGSRLSFFSICLSAAITYSGDAADYFVYYPSNTPRWKVGLAVFIGLTSSFTYEFVVGIGLASGIATTPSWSDAYEVSQGALLVEGLRPLGAFGSFCAVVMALGLIANLILPTYSGGVDFQILGRYFLKVPRIVWNTASMIIYTVCALAGRKHLAEIFTNFLALMGYWTSIWVAITVEDHLIFRWKKQGFDWSIWNDKSKLPLGIAAFIAFLIGWAGAILSMAQVWYIGPIAGLVGDYGADMGNYLGFTWAALVYPPLRWLELRYVGR